VREKRDAVIEKLLASPEFIEHSTNKWADLLQVNSKFLGKDGAELFREWIRQEMKAKTPYDEFARKILTASGSNKTNPAASYWKILRDPVEAMENTTHLFLATRFNCNKCHDYPFERWTQDQYYHTAAFFSQVALDADPAAGGAKLGATDVEKPKPLKEIVRDKTDGEVTHLRTNKIAAPEFPYPVQAATKGTRREQLAAWMTSPDNRYFATSYVNRLWCYLTGAGVIEPLDDIRAGNPPSNPELLDFLTKEFLAHHFDVRHVTRLICQARTYQLGIGTNPWNADDKTNCAHALARRLPTEVLYDSVLKADTKLAGLTGVAIEVLPSGEEKKFGPGRAPDDGNFVLGEVELKVSAGGTDATPVPVKFASAVADFSQEDFEIAQAIDGIRDNEGNGWAISASYGVPHFAALTLEKPLGDAGKGVRLRFELNQPRKSGFAIARFRLWVTTDAAPVQVGYPQPFSDALKKIPAARTADDKAALAAYWNANDPELAKRRFLLAQAPRLFPPDPGLVQRRAAASAEVRWSSTRSSSASARTPNNPKPSSPTASSPASKTSPGR